MNSNNPDWLEGYIRRYTNTFCFLTKNDTVLWNCGVSIDNKDTAVFYSFVALRLYFIAVYQ